MSTDDLRASIAAVEDEISGLSPAVKRKLHRKRFPWVALVITLSLFIVVDWIFLGESGSGVDDDLIHMMQQARHEVLDYKHHYGRMPNGIQNVALRPYITLTAGGNDRFVLKGQMGEETQILIVE